MNDVLDLLASQPLLLLFGLLGAGAAIGHLKVRGVGLGAAAVLFLALGVGALGAANGVEVHVPEAFGVLGLTLFTFTVGIVSGASLDRKSTRLNSSHVKISYAVFCLKKKKKNRDV